MNFADGSAPGKAEIIFSSARAGIIPGCSNSGFSLYDSKSDFLFNVDLHSILDGMGYERDYQNIACDDFYMDLLNNEIFTEDDEHKPLLKLSLDKSIGKKRRLLFCRC